ncbi:MAG: substrate-binding domain-containing protein [Candidatus Devosia symbiotica]|nr:substrate-binding domain-containing protein [Candidatus Devosia symbiotica]
MDCCVGFSHADAGHAAAEFAVEVGYLNAATITAGDERAARRLNAFATRFVRQIGSTISRVDFDASASLGLGRQALTQLLARHFLPKSIVFCSFDQFTRGVLIETNKRSLSIPDDQEFTANTEPALTRIRIDRQVLGQVAANALIEGFATNAPPQSIHDIDFEIIRRNSA